MNKLVVIALDGTPYSLLNKLISSGVTPNLKEISQNSGFRKMDSTLPTVSSVAWASFLTGKEPLHHEILGFVDRDPQTMDWYIPLANRLNSSTFLEVLSSRGRQIFCMNMPMTYPPQKINGIIISGFLAPELEKATYPVHLGKVLKAKGYQIDADVELAKSNLKQFILSLEAIMNKRFEIAGEYINKKSWDLFMFHIMETDRLQHFTWKYMEEGHPELAEFFYRFYKKLDHQIGLFLEKMPKDMELMILSDHGFTEIKREVQINRFLFENGYLSFTTDMPETLRDIRSQSKAYSLYPGRIYINLKFREKTGSVHPGLPYEKVRSELKQLFFDITDPFLGEKIVEDIVTPEEWLARKGFLSLKIGERQDDLRRYAPDLFLIPAQGYDLKGSLWSSNVFDNTVHNGMHTYDDAFLMVRDCQLSNERFSIIDVAPIIFELLEEEVPKGMGQTKNFVKMKLI